MTAAFQKGPRFGAPRKRSFAINITPLIDVLFLLLIFLLISTTLRVRPALDLDLPRTRGSGASPAERHTLSILRDGSYHLQGRWVSPGDLPSRLEGLYRRAGEDSLSVEVDRNANSESLVYALDVARQSGYKQINLPTVIVSGSPGHGGN